MGDRQAEALEGGTPGLPVPPALEPRLRVSRQNAWTGTKGRSDDKAGAALDRGARVGRGGPAGSREARVLPGARGRCVFLRLRSRRVPA